MSEPHKVIPKTKQPTLEIECEYAVVIDKPGGSTLVAFKPTSLAHSSAKSCVDKEPVKIVIHDASGTHESVKPQFIDSVESSQYHNTIIIQTEFDDGVPGGGMPVGMGYNREYLVELTKALRQRRKR